MTEDELLLHVRSYADQAMRGLGGVGGTAPALQVSVSVETDDYGSFVEVSYVSADGDVAGTASAENAARRLVDLMTGDTLVQVTDRWEDSGKFFVTVSDRQTYQAARKVEDADWLGEDEVAEPLSLLEGPIQLTIPYWPELSPNRPTRALVMGFNLEGKSWTGKPYWQRDFPDLERAEYWAVKQERDHKAQGYRASAAVVWQHDVTVEEVAQKALDVMNGKMDT